MIQTNLFEEEQESPSFELWPHQIRAKGELRQAMKMGHKRVVLQIATGGGKTRLCAEIILDALKKGSKVVFAVPLKALVDQTVREFQEAGIKDIGVIQAQHAMTDWMAPVQVASIQTLIRRPLPEADLIIIDECHIFYRGLWKCVDSEQWKDKFVIGLSATPWAKGMGRRWGCLVICGTTAELIDSGVLCHYRIMVPPDEFKPDRSKVQVKDGEFVDDSAITALSEPKLVGNVVNTWLEYGPGCETFLYGQNCAHAKDMQKEFQNAGINCGYIDGDSEEDEILDMWKKYDSHEYPVVASVGCLVAGIDKRVQCIILDMMTKSIIKYMQIVGRSFRTNGDPDKVALILDHGGNTLVLGEPRNIQYDHLDMSKPSDKGSAYQGEKEPPKPRECKHCHHIINRAAKTCPYCHEALVPVKDSDVIHEEGELVEFGSHKKKKERVYTMEEKQDWYSGFLHIAQERGKSEGFAAHRYRDKFKVWPNQLKKEPKPPSFEVEQFDRHCRIAWAKSQKKKEAAVA